MEINKTANQERKSHGLPYFFVYTPFGSFCGEGIILSFSIKKTVIRNKNHIQTESEPRNFTNAETDSGSPEIHPRPPVQKINCFSEQFQVSKNRMYSAQKKQ